MSLPVLDQDSYQAVCSEWTAYAGELLRQHGYLQSTPTGIYDEEFAAAVDAFQAAQGIAFESRQVGWLTWQALGAQDPEAPPDDSFYDQDALYPEADAPPATTAFDPGLEVFADGKRWIIYPDEVRSGGTISWRARNPGNIRNGEKYGAYPGKKANTKSAGSFAVFPDEDTGFEAIKRVLRGYGQITVVKAMNKYAPSSDGNDPEAYARSVAKEIGVTPETLVTDLDDSQMDTFATAVKRVEGWTVGTSNALDDPSLPPLVQAGIRGE